MPGGNTARAGRWEELWIDSSGGLAGLGDGGAAFALDLAARPPARCDASDREPDDIRSRCLHGRWTLHPHRWRRPGVPALPSAPSRPPALPPVRGLNAPRQRLLCQHRGRMRGSPSSCMPTGAAGRSVARSLCSESLTPIERSSNSGVARWFRSPGHRTSLPFRRASGAVPSNENHLFPPREDTTTQLTRIVRSFRRRDERRDLLEYALLVALIVLVVISAVRVAGGSITGLLGPIADTI